MIRMGEQGGDRDRWGGRKREGEREIAPTCQNSLNDPGFGTVCRFSCQQ